MTHLVDINVVFALLVKNHVHHPVSWQWWERREDNSVGMCLLCRMGVLRLLTNNKAMNDNAISPEAALEAWDAFSADPRTLWVDVPKTSHEMYFRRYVEGRKSTPNLWTDAWLAALAESMTIGLTSFDSGFNKFQLKDFELLQGKMP